MKKYLFLIYLVTAFINLFSQSKFENGKVQVIHCSSFGISKPLRELLDSASSEKDFSKIKMKEAEDMDGRTTPRSKYTEADGAEYGNDPSVCQTTMGNRQAQAPIVNWLGQIGNFYPPDPTGAAGPNDYVQCVNSTPIKIYNKVSGTAIGSFSNLGSLWSPAVSNGGDPIVLYDKFADRWFISQIGTPGTGDLHTYIAISTTPDPTGTYYTYSYLTGQFPDYEKFSIWADGYYMTANQNTDNVYCFERDSMLAGRQSARMVSATFNTGTTSSFFIPLTADADGLLPPYGTPLPFFSVYDNNWGGGGSDAIKIWEIQVTWGTMPTAVISTTPVSVVLSPFVCGNSTGNDISQPLTTQKLDGLVGFLNFRAQWRQWSGYSTVVLNFGVTINAHKRGIRWVELRQDSVTQVWTKHQEGTFAPNDTSSRWCGSIAMDDNQSIGLCYSKSSTIAGDYPSLAYTARIASDPLGQMTFAETIAFQGTGSQTQTNRWGDYSQTCIDPSDGITFWHTGEYGTNISPNCATRIYTFQISPLGNGIAEYQNAQGIINAFQSDNEINVIGTNLSTNDELIVDLFDSSGKRISGKKVNPTSNSFETTFDISALAKGIYLVRVGKMNSSFQKVKKIMVH